MRVRLKETFLLLILLLSAGALFGQGVQTATLQGTVTDPSGAALPGVTVTAKSPALLGERTALTQTNGAYIMPGLPPGQYSIAFELDGMQKSEVTKALPLGLTTTVDAKLKLATVTEAITVTAASTAVLENTTVGANIKAETVQQLPVLRTPTDIGSLSPGVTGDRGGRATTPIPNQLSISGGMAYDNNFLIDGVNFQDNIFGNTNNLFVEDAIQETQVLTSGISAEYGHFTGGVLNVITKSGGNDIAGSLRDDLSKGTWLALTPYEQGFRGQGAPGGARTPHSGKLSNIWEGTLGGPILRDRLWFFLAGRKDSSTTPGQTPVTGYGYNVVQTNNRPEVKLTANLGAGQTLQADYIDNPVKRTNEVQVAPLDTTAISTNSVRQNRGYTAFYSGVFSTNLFAEARFARKHFGFRGLGGTSTNIIDSPFESSSQRYPGEVSGTFNAPYFDATDPEDRDNRQAFAALSYFKSTSSFGSHEIKGGLETFTDIERGGGSQSSTNYTFYTNYALNSDGTPQLDSGGHLIPVFNPESADAGASTRIAFWLATRGAELDSRTNSLFINDRWALNSHFNFNIGARYEKVKSTATGGIVPVDTSNLVPRLAASYDPKGDGSYKFDVTYGEYVGRYNPALVGPNASVGNPALLYGYYTGPAGQGRNFAPGFDPANYTFYYAFVPTANVAVGNNLHAPISREVSLSGGMALPKGGWTKATFTDRRYKDFIESFINIANGCTNVTLGGVDAGCQDNIVYRNSNGPKREYQAVDLQSHYNITRSWGVDGNWTHQFKNDGNYEGETGQGIGVSPFGDWPEMQSLRELPTGHLAQFEADRLRLWTSYTFGLGRAGNLTSGLLYRYDSPLTFSYTATVPRSSISNSLNPGYNSAPGSILLYFGDRGAGQYNSTSLFDLSLQWSMPIARVTPWVKVDVRNVFNDATLIQYNTTIKAAPGSPQDSLGYPTQFVRSASFGRPNSAANYVLPRQFLLYAGIRF